MKPSKPTKPATALAVVPAADALTIAPADYSRILDDMTADLRAFDRCTRHAALLALRNGCRVLALRHATGYKRGGLNAFIKLLKPRGLSERSLWDHYGVAVKVAESLGWLDAKGHVKNTAALKAFYSLEQADYLQSLDNAGAELPPALKDAVDYIGQRSIKDLLKDLREEGTAPGAGLALPPKAKGGKPDARHADLQAAEDAKNAAQAMLEFMATSKVWKLLEDGELNTLAANAATFVKEAGDHLKRHKRKGAGRDE